MLEFKKITHSDIKTIEPYLINDKSAICDRTLGVVYLFKDYYSYCIEDGTLFLKSELKNNDGFLMPVSLKNETCTVADLLKIKEYASFYGEEAKLCYLTGEEADRIKTLFGEREVTYNGDYSDYIYNAEDLITLKGKKFNGQRNFTNRFKKTYSNWHTEQLSDGNLELIDEFLNAYYAKTKKSSEIFKDEKKNVYEFLNNVKDFGFLTLALFIEDKPVAFAVGERKGNVLFVHEEKADVSVKGSYQMIVNEFAKKYAVDGVTEINREDDAGDEGLRTSKKSYHPIKLLPKYSVKI